MCQGKMPVFDHLHLLSSNQARSSSQCKQLFKEIQEQKNENPLQLLIDMKVHWGSTLAMLNRAETKRDVSCHPLSFSLTVTHRSLQFVDQFILELRRREMNTEKCRKLADMALTEEEWD